MWLAEIAFSYQFLFALYGDPAYPMSPVLSKPFVSGATITVGQRIYNYYGARARVTVEWYFGDLKQYWSTVCHWKLFRLHAVPCPRYMRVAAFFTNCLNCHFPNRGEKYFDCKPPSMPAYFAVLRAPAQADVTQYPHVY